MTSHCGIAIVFALWLYNKIESYHCLLSLLVGHPHAHLDNAQAGNPKKMGFAFGGRIS
jgi:hypothetical protein